MSKKKKVEESARRRGTEPACHQPPEAAAHLHLLGPGRGGRSCPLLPRYRESEIPPPSTWRRGRRHRERKKSQIQKHTNPKAQINRRKHKLKEESRNGEKQAQIGKKKAQIDHKSPCLVPPRPNRALTAATCSPCGAEAVCGGSAIRHCSSPQSPHPWSSSMGNSRLPPPNGGATSSSSRRHILVPGPPRSSVNRSVATQIGGDRKKVRRERR